MTSLQSPLVRIVDDDEGMRTAYSLMLEAEGWKVAAYASADAFFRDDSPSRPGCVLADFRMPVMNGLEMYREMRRRDIRLPVIFLTAHGDVDLAVQAMKDGAADFLNKPADEERLLATIAAAVDRDMRRHAGIRAPELEKALYSELTKREREVVRLAGRGLLNREIGEALNISEKTVQAHRAAAYRRLGVRNAAELSRLLLRIGEAGS